MKVRIINVLFFSILLFCSCSVTKYVPEGHYLLDEVSVKTDVKGFDVSSVRPYIRQRNNTRWFALLRVPLSIYSMSGRDSTKWGNKILRRLGEKPVILDTLQTNYSVADMKAMMRNMGYLHADLDVDVKKKGRKAKVVYRLYPNEPYTLSSVKYVVEDPEVNKILCLDQPENQGIHCGEQFSVARLDDERSRISKILLDSGYYKFNKEFIRYIADTSRYSNQIDLTLVLMKYRPTTESQPVDHQRFRIRKLSFLSNDSIGMQLRRKVLEYNTPIRVGEYYSASNLQRAYNNFARLQAVKFTNISFDEAEEQGLLDCSIQLSFNKPRTISFEPEGTNTAGDLGAAASFTYQNRNLFHGSELLSVRLRGAYEAITGLEGYQDQNYIEYGLETKLSIPRFIAPLLSQSFRERQGATSEFTLSYNHQNRPEFHRKLFSTSMRFRWTDQLHHTAYRIDLIDLNYIYMPWIAETFKHDYLDSVSNRNAILRYNYEDLLIMKIGFGLTYRNRSDAIIMNVETAGNLLQALSRPFNLSKNDNGQYKLFNIAYAQYVKFDFDYTFRTQFDARNSLVFHTGIGIACPYGNSTILPFEKRYFSGGANSVRGWSVRELGPGKFRGTDGRIDFINQTGDMKLDLNLEFRTFLFWKLDGALFIDAGNIWTLRNNKDQPGGQFVFGEFYKQIAASYGFGLRLNFDYFLLRFDMGMRAVNPAYDDKRQHFPLFYPDFGRDFRFHFAVGMPF